MGKPLPLFASVQSASATHDGAMSFAFHYFRAAPIGAYGGGTLCGHANVEAGRASFKLAETRQVPVGQAYGSPVVTALVSKLYALSRGKL